jgi:hypothetical protein
MVADAGLRHIPKTAGLPVRFRTENVRLGTYRGAMTGTDHPSESPADRQTPGCHNLASTQHRSAAGSGQPGGRYVRVHAR